MAETNAVIPRGVRVVQAETLRDLEACDKLPRSIRRLLWEAPFNMSAEYVLKQVRTAGRRAVKAEYADDCAALLGRPYTPPGRHARQKRTYR